MRHISISETDAAAECRRLGQVLLLYKQRDLEALEAWRAKYDLGQCTKLFTVSDESWHETKNMFVVRQHQGPIVIWSTDAAPLTGMLQREIFNLRGRELNRWLVRCASTE